MFDPHTSATSQPPPTPVPVPVHNPVRKLVLSGLLIAVASATVAFWPEDGPPPVAVVESGFHLAPDRDDQDAVWAVVVENTSDDEVGNASLRFTFHDDDGESDDSQIHTLPPLEPGERRIATGTHSEQSLQGGHLGTRDGLAGPPVDMTVDVEDSSHPTDSRWPSEITISDTWVGWAVDPLNRETLAIAVDLEEDLRTHRPPTIRLVFRDADDRIIGGRSFVAPVPAGQPSLDDGPRQLFVSVLAEQFPADLASFDVQVLEGTV